MTPALMAGRPGTPETPAAEGTWRFCLYVAGQTPKALTAFENLKTICEEYLAGRYAIEVIDLAADPGRAVRDRIVAVPTLVRRRPTPMQRIIGDLSDTGKVLAGLGLRERLLMDDGELPGTTTAEFERALAALGTEQFVLRLYIAGNSPRSRPLSRM